jgi:molecular chaperone GrpE
LENNKSRIIEQFKQLLDQTETVDSIDEPEKPVGLAQVFSELAVLKTEVRTEARQFKSALDTLQKLADASTEQQQGWETERQRYRKEVGMASAHALQPVLLELLSIRDRLVAAIDAWNAFRPGFFKRRFLKHELRLLKSIAEGQTMILARFDHLLSAQGVRPINSIGQAFDPVSMRAAERVTKPKQENGIVISEIAQGYYWNDEILRLAEVVVNKLDG